MTDRARQLAGLARLARILSERDMAALGRIAQDQARIAAARRALDDLARAPLPHGPTGPAEAIIRDRWILHRAATLEADAQALEARRAALIAQARMSIGRAEVLAALVRQGPGRAAP